MIHILLLSGFQSFHKFHPMSLSPFYYHLPHLVIIPGRYLVLLSMEINSHRNVFLPCNFQQLVKTFVKQSRLLSHSILEFNILNHLLVGIKLHLCSPKHHPYSRHNISVNKLCPRQFILSVGICRHNAYHRNVCHHVECIMAATHQNHCTGTKSSILLQVSSTIVRPPASG